MQQWQEWKDGRERSGGVNFGAEQDDWIDQPTEPQPPLVLDDHSVRWSQPGTPVWPVAGSAAPRRPRSTARHPYSAGFGALAALAILGAAGFAIITNTGHWNRQAAPYPAVQAGPQNTPTPSPTVTPLPTVTATPIPTATPVPTATPLPTETPLPDVAPVPTDTPEPTETPEPSPTAEPTDTPTDVPEPTDTIAPTDTTAPTDTAAPTDTVAPQPSTTAAPDDNTVATPTASGQDNLAAPLVTPSQTRHDHGHHSGQKHG